MLFCKLSELPEGESATIRSIEGDEISLKLLEIGLIPGESIRMEINKKSTLPLVVYLGGSSISLRPEEAENIIVEHTI